MIPHCLPIFTSVSDEIVLFDVCFRKDINLHQACSDFNCFRSDTRCIMSKVLEKKIDHEDFRPQVCIYRITTFSLNY